MIRSADQKVALIVGGSSGIGKAAARKLLERDVSVVLLARNPEKLSSAKNELSKHGTVETVEVDLNDENQIQGFIQLLDDEERHLQYLVNAAGVFRPTAFLDHSPSEYDRYHQLNRAAFFITQAVARNM